MSAAQRRRVPEIIAVLVATAHTRLPVILTPTEAAQLIGHVNRLTTLLSAALQGNIPVDSARETLRDSIPATQRVRHATRGAGLRYNGDVTRIEWDDGTVTLGWIEGCEDTP